MGSYVRQQRNFSVDNKNEVSHPSENLSQSSYYELQYGNSETIGTKETLIPTTDVNGYQYRKADIGRVITQAEILTRIVPFWELFISAVGLFGYHIVTMAMRNIGGPGAASVLFFHGCNSEFYQPNVDLCATSILSWSLIGGAVFYFSFITILSILLYIECYSQGYPGAFTALWNSPFFLFCYCFREQYRIDLLSIPNRFVGFKKWTRFSLHRFALAFYSLITTLLVTYYLTRKTVDNDDFIAQKEYKNGDGLYLNVV
ncbi:5369_t:CDS:2 [Diversispora eburnea]|uniref:5369_t:CDS:1 n=1 Tax=Diversispora eburnea TaxID=1213867 RepID=A0A9N9FEK8_9GLOM|nr:5369_t:CDS:2 [Diversispora eburnea]